MKIWVYAESEGDKPTTATLELVTKARELGDVECVYVGPEAATVSAVGQLEGLRSRLQKLDGPMLLDCRITPEVVADSRSLLGALIRTGAA